MSIRTLITVACGDGVGPEIGRRMGELVGSAVKLVTIDRYGAVVQRSQTVHLLRRFDAAGEDFIKMESLFNFDGHPGYSLGQGQ